MQLFTANSQRSTCFYNIIPAATVSFVPSSIKITLPVCLFLLYASKKSGCDVLMLILAISFISNDKIPSMR